MTEEKPDLHSLNSSLEEKMFGVVKAASPFLVIASAFSIFAFGWAKGLPSSIRALAGPDFVGALLLHFALLIPSFAFIARVISTMIEVTIKNLEVLDEENKHTGLFKQLNQASKAIGYALALPVLCIPYLGTYYGLLYLALLLVIALMGITLVVIFETASATFWNANPTDEIVLTSVRTTLSKRPFFLGDPFRLSVLVICFAFAMNSLGESKFKSMKNERDTQVVFTDNSTSTGSVIAMTSTGLLLFTETQSDGASVENFTFHPMQSIQKLTFK